MFPRVSVFLSCITFSSTGTVIVNSALYNNDTLLLLLQCYFVTHSTVNSFSPTGMQQTNCIALHSRWNSVHSSMFMTPLLGTLPCHVGSSRYVLNRVNTISNIERPQQRRSLVSRSPSPAMSACCNQKALGMGQLADRVKGMQNDVHWLTHTKLVGVSYI